MSSLLAFSFGIIVPVAVVLTILGIERARKRHHAENQTDIPADIEIPAGRIVFTGPVGPDEVARIRDLFEGRQDTGRICYLPEIDTRAWLKADLDRELLNAPPRAPMGD